MTATRIVGAALTAVLCGPAAAGPYVVCDNGLRCVTAPCPSTNALDLQSGLAVRVSGVDLTWLEKRDRARAERERASDDGSLVVEGSVVESMLTVRGRSQPQPIFVATRIERASTGRERRQCRSPKEGPSPR